MSQLLSAVYTTLVNDWRCEGSMQSEKIWSVCEGRKLGLTIAINKVSVVEKECQFLQVEINFDRNFGACWTPQNNLAAVIVRLIVRRTSWLLAYVKRECSVWCIKGFHLKNELYELVLFFHILTLGKGKKVQENWKSFSES